MEKINKDKLKNYKINAAVIGLGVGKHHLYNLIKIKEIDKVYVYDINKKKYRNLKNKKIIIAKNYKEILFNSKISLVCISSYDHCHYKQIIDCLKNKKNIFAEKPICLNLKDFHQIQKYAKKFKKKNFLQFCFKISKRI